MQREPDPPITEIDGPWDPRLRVFRAGREVDTFALVTRRYVIVVDTMSTPEHAGAILERLRLDLAGRTLLVVNSHADYDHCWGNAVFSSPGGAYPAPIIAHEAAHRRMRSQQAHTYLREQQQQQPRYASVRLVPPTITFAGSLHIDGEDLTVSLLEAPGHTEDLLAVWVPELRLLLATDAAEQPFPFAHDPAGLPALRATLARLAGLGAEMVIPCHGGITDPGLLDRNLAYFADVERQTRQALAEGRIGPEMIGCADLDELIGLPYGDAVRAAGADPASVAGFYRDCHLRTIRAMAQQAAAGA